MYHYFFNCPVLENKFINFVQIPTVAQFLSSLSTVKRESLFRETNLKNSRNQIFNRFFLLVIMWIGSVLGNMF